MELNDYQENYGYGWIKLYRSVKKHWLIEKNRSLTFFEAWIMMLLDANHSGIETRIGYEVIKCERGESINSLDTWAKMFNWHKSKVRRFFKLLEKDSMIILNKCEKTTHLTICNYELYQGERNASETQVKRKRNASETQVTPNNNVKNDNNDNNEKIIPTFEIFKSYALEQKKNIDLESLKMKYEAWKINDWKDGYNKPIKNWKSKLLNTIPHLKMDEDTGQKKDRYESIRDNK